MTMQAQEKFHVLLRKLFEFDCTDLDFGIYRIMNYKRQVIERFIAEDLPKAIHEELRSGALAEQAQAQEALQSARQKVIDTLGADALDADGSLADKYRETRAGKEYLEAQAKAKGARSSEALEAAIYNHLYTFFSRYWQDGDFISKRRYSKKERYAIPYNGEEVTLYWANRDQYYIKTGEYFTDYTYQSPHGVTVQFKLQKAEVEQNNVKGEKRFFLPVLNGISWDRGTLTIPFQFRPLTEQENIAYGQKNQQEAIIAQAVVEIPKRLKKTVEALAALTAERSRTEKGEAVSWLEHHLRQYTRRNTSDFFIHKDLKGFLSRELDFYLKNEVLNLEELEAAGETLAEGWFQLMRLVKRIGNAIINFLAQIEGFQKMLWEKKKFVTETFYVVTVGNIPEAFCPEIAACEAQWQEWKALLHIDEEQSNLFTAGKGKKDKRLDFLKAHPTLPLDTRHFPQDFTDRLLASFDNLDELTDGLLVHSENWQALNLLQEKYRERVKCIYIDPPYNTNATEIIYKNEYRDSSWLALIQDRILNSIKLCSGEGIHCVTIDDVECPRLWIQLEQIFGPGNHLGTACIRSNPGGRKRKRQLALQHAYALFFAKECSVEISKLAVAPEHKTHTYKKDEKGQWYELRNLRKEGIDSAAKPDDDRYYPIYFDPSTGRISSQEKLPVEIWPIDSKGVKRIWRRSKEDIDQLAKCGEIVCQKTNKGYQFYLRYRGGLEGETPKSLWIDARFSASEYGTPILDNILGKREVFDFPKSVYAVAQCIKVMSSQTDCYILDYFAGSGTTGHAVINLNRDDGVRRKFILVEMTHYFDTVLLPRIKKVTFTPEWRDGKPKRLATAEEAERSPRIVKVIRLESYEDALNNLTFDDESGQRALELFKDDYLLHYMLKWETRHSETLLNVEKLQTPFSYKLRLHRDGETRERAVDLPETFNYLLGLEVQARKVYDDDGRRYLVYRGMLRNGRRVAVIWRETQGWTKDDYDRDIVAEQKLTDGADEVFVNGDSLIPGAQSLDPIFKDHMFAPLGV